MTESTVQKKSTSNFNDTAGFYHEHAEVQKKVADRLIASLKPWQDILPPGPILELGCGTGYVSRHLQELFKNRELVFSDVAPGMLDVCRKNLENHQYSTFKLLDAEEVPAQEPAYAMTISNFVAQWFRDPAYTLGQWLQATQPGGLLLAAFPGNESFPEWRKHAEVLGLPFTGNDLPDTEEMVIKLSSDYTQVDYYEDTITQTFESAADFFRHLKNIGAGRQLKGRPLTSNEMKLLISYWDESAGDKITVSYHVVFLAVKKNHSSS